VHFFFGLLLIKEERIRNFGLLWGLFLGHWPFHLCF